MQDANSGLITNKSCQDKSVRVYDKRFKFIDSTMIVNTLEFLMKSRRLASPSEIASKSELNYTTVRKILLNRDVVPSGNTLSQLCSLFQIPVGNVIQHLEVADRFKDEFNSLPATEQNRIIDCSRYFHVEKQRLILSNNHLKYPIDYDHYESLDYNTVNNFGLVLKYFRGEAIEEIDEMIENILGTKNK